MTRYYIGLGSNLGDKMSYLEQAVQLLTDIPQTRISSISSAYQSAPWGKTDQPSFLNAVVAVDTDLSAQVLHRYCQHIEQRLGRIRHEKWGARTIDLDILCARDFQCHTETLQVPHPYITVREFVLRPLSEIAPAFMLYGRSVAEWLQKVPKAGQVYPVGRLHHKQVSV